MKMRSLHQRKKRKTLQVVVGALIMVAVAVLLPKFFSAVATALMYPVHATSVWLNESEDIIPLFFRERRDLAKEIKKLETDLVASGSKELTMRKMQIENNRLRALLRIDESSYIAAAVIARPNQLPYDLLQIDRGSAHGVEVGAPVFVAGDVVLGLVVHTTLNYSFVELLSSPGFTATAYVLGPNVIAPLEGMGGGVSRIRLPQGVPLRENDLVILPTIQSGVVGVVSYLEQEPTQPEQYGYIPFNVPIASLHYVNVGQVSLISKSSEQIDETVRMWVRTSLDVSDLELQTASSTASSTEVEVDNLTPNQSL